MTNKCNFIVTHDKQTADKLAFAGLQFVSQSANTYTFLNQLPKNFNFEDVDYKKIIYTNTLNV